MAHGDAGLAADLWLPPASADHAVLLWLHTAHAVSGPHGAEAPGHAGHLCCRARLPALLAAPQPGPDGRHSHEVGGDQGDL